MTGLFLFSFSYLDENIPEKKNGKINRFRLKRTNKNIFSSITVERCPMTEFILFFFTKKWLKISGMGNNKGEANLTFYVCKVYVK